MTRRDYKYDPEYSKFRRAVRARDEDSCQYPGCKFVPKRYTDLHVHHIRSWSKYPTLRYDLDNGITLCKKHHDITIGHEDNFLALFLQIVKRKKLNND